MSTWVITGNATIDGRPIYRRADRSWSAHLDEASSTDVETERDAWLADARGAEFVVCDPYPIEVQVDDGRPRATSLRESIRATGPTAATLANRPRPEGRAT
jgi:hypothetical protein